MPEQGALPLTPEAPAVAAAPVVVPKIKGRFELPADPAPKATEVTTPEAPAAAESEAQAPAQNTEEQAPSAESEGEKPEVETPEQAAKRQGRRFERKLDKAYRQRAEAQARAELLEKQLAETRAANAPAKAEGEPTLAQFDYDPEKYAAAKADFATKQAEKNLTEKQRTQAQQAERQRLTSAWEEKVDRAQDKYEDWAEVVGELQPDSAFTAAIMEADNGEDIAHYLGKHPKEAERIAKLQPLSQIREIGKLEAKLASTPEKPKTPSKAPAPIAPLTGAAPVASSGPSEQDDFKTWMRKRQKQVHGRT